MYWCSLCVCLEALTNMAFNQNHLHEDEEFLTKYTTKVLAWKQTGWEAVCGRNTWALTRMHIRNLVCSIIATVLCICVHPSRAEEIARLVNCSPLKHEDLSSSPRTHKKCQGRWCVLVISVPGRRKQEARSSWLSSPPSLTGEEQQWETVPGGRRIFEDDS